MTIKQLLKSKKYIYWWLSEHQRTKRFMHITANRSSTANTQYKDSPVQKSTGKGFQDTVWSCCFILFSISGNILRSDSVTDPLITHRLPKLWHCQHNNKQILWILLVQYRKYCFKFITNVPSIHHNTASLIEPYRDISKPLQWAGIKFLSHTGYDSNS